MKNRESEIQRSCVQWFRLMYKEPNYMIFAVPNGGKRGRIEAAIMKGEGVRAGVSDLIVLTNNRVLFIEMKAEKTAHSDSQKQFQKIVEGMGFAYYLCRSFDKFRQVILTELN